MKFKARMHKTLASLAVAMTVTSVILHWLDPSLHAVGMPPDRDQLATLSQTAVFDAVPIKPHAWREVEIVVNPLQDSGLALAASPNQDDVHFHVDGRGRPHRDAPWSRQRPVDDAPGIIRIQVDQSGPNDAPVGPAQWLAVQCLVDSLGQALGRTSTLPVRFALDDSRPAFVR